MTWKTTKHRQFYTLIAIAMGLSGLSSHSSANPSMARCDGSICLTYLVALEDSDGDGVSDTDEIALGTDPHDPSSHPPALKIAKFLYAGRLESFNRGFSEVVVLPTKAPDGKDLLPASVAELKPETLDALGISTKTLSRFGISIDSGFTLSHALPQSDAQSTGGSAPPVKVGGIDIALISADETGVNMGPGFCMGCQNPQPETVKTDSTLWDKVKEFFGFGKKEEGTDGGTAGGGKPDAGTRTDPDSVQVLPLTEEDFQRAWFLVRGGTISRTAGIDIPSPVDSEDPVLGEDPNGPIILVDPEQSDQPFGSRNKLILVKMPTFKDKREQNTTYGPSPLDGSLPPWP